MSPVAVHFADPEYPDGHLTLDGLQFRGHGMFSNSGLPVDAPTVEYAWLVEVILGRIDGRLHPTQLVKLAQFLVRI